MGSSKKKQQQETVITASTGGGNNRHSGSTGTGRSSSTTSTTSRSVGYGSSSQKIRITLKFFDTDGNYIRQEDISNKEIGKPDDTIGIVFNKDNCSNNFITKNNGIIQYTLESQSYGWLQECLTVTPGNSEVLDDVYYKAFSFTLNTSLSKAIIDHIEYSVGNTDTNPNWNTGDILKSNTTDESKIESDDITVNGVAVGKFYTEDNIKYPISYNILSFDYYSKYKIDENSAEEYGEVRFIPAFPTVYLQLRVYLNIKDLLRLSLDIFPPKLEDKLLFIPDLKDLTGLNLKYNTPFTFEIKSYFRIYTLNLIEYISEKIEIDNNGTIEEIESITKRKNELIVPEDRGEYGKGPGVIKDDNVVKLQSLDDINVFYYEITITPKEQDLTLEFDQSGDELLPIYLNDITHKNREELVDYECAVKVFSNNTAIGRLSETAINDILIGKPFKQGTYEIARYSLKEGCKEFGDIYIFYGNIQLRKVGDILKYSTDIINDELVVYLKFDPFGNSNNNISGETLSLNDYICINMVDVVKTSLAEIDTSKPIKITNIANISQESDVVFSSNINIPLVNFNDETVFIDSAQNSNKLQHYSYVSTFSNNSTTSYLGVRAYQRNTNYYNTDAVNANPLFSYKFSNLNISGLTYNTNAELVLLTPYTTQEIIYSFRNGKQSMQVKKSMMDFSYSEAAGVKVKDLLPSYALSYEYLVDGKTDIKNQYNISFYGIKEHKDWVKSYFTYLDVNYITDRDKYLFTISYIDTSYTGNSDILKLLENVDENYPLYNNIYYTNYSTNTDNELTSTDKFSILEEKFVKIPGYNTSYWKDLDNIYEPVDKYIKISASSIKLIDFKTVVRNYYSRLEVENITDEEKDKLNYSIYYKYSSISKEYNPYTLNDIKDITDVPYNLYYRTKYYLKYGGLTKNNAQNILTSGNQYYKELYYKEWNNTLITNPKIENGLIYLHYKNGFTYMPLYLGIKYDGSVQYYSDNNYYLIDTENSDYRNEERFSINSNSDTPSIVYLKQKYKFIDKLNSDKFYELSNKGYKFFKKVNTVKYIPIPKDSTIYELDLSGDVVYADGNKKIISKNDISYLYYLADIDPDNNASWASAKEAEIHFSNDNKKETINIKQDNKEAYLLNTLHDPTLDNDSFPGLKYIVDFDGEFIEVSYAEISVALENTEELSEYYINKEGYNEFDTNTLSFNSEFYGINGTAGSKVTNYLYYGYNFKFYLKGMSKIPIDKIKEVENSEADLYINISRLFDNADAPNIDNDTLKAPEELQISGKDTSNDNKIILAKIYKKTDSSHESGEIVNTTYFEYYKREPNTITSYDIHNNINKKYYTKQNYTVSLGEITLKDNKSLSLVNKITETETIQDGDDKGKINKETQNTIVFTEASGLNVDNRRYNIDTFKIYEKGISYYSTTNLGKNAESIKSKLSSYYTFNKPTSDITYSYEILMQSNFFYSSYTINDGINIAKDGSYYTNISVFDGKNGLITKSLYLNPHIYTVTNYKYTYYRENEVVVTQDMDLTNVAENEYKNYTIKKPNKELAYSLDADIEHKSPAWWQSYIASHPDYSLKVKIYEEAEGDYNGQIVSDKEGNTNYQFFDKYVSRPYVIHYNSNIYGLIFKENPYEVRQSNDFLIDANEINDIDAKAITLNPNTGKPYGVYSDKAEAEVDQRAFEILGETYNKDTDNNDGDIYDRDDANFLKAKHYYENFDLGSVMRKVHIHYVPAEYEYEIVPLQEFIYKSKGIDDNVFQNRESIQYDLKQKNAFELSNSKEIKFTGTYTWIQPEFTYIGTYISTYNAINPEETTYVYRSKKVISRSGYWSKDYIEEEVPLKISSYNFYPKDEISSVNITYNYQPYSYVMSAEIYHPEITYDYLINDIYEYYKYTYIINGIEKDYPLDGEIILNPDNTYSGVIEVLNIPEEKKSGTSSIENISQLQARDIAKIKVKLYKKLDLGVKSNVKNIVHQSAYTSYNWYAYIQATPLTNEKVPYLYKKEIIPGHTKKVQYWNKATNSYAVKEVIDSYSYYSYEYTYEVIPFKVASYIFTDDLRISNFYDLGAYIIELKDGLNSVLSQQAEATQKLNTTIDGAVTDLTSLIQNESTKWNTNYTNQTNIINSTFNSFREEHANNLSKLSNILDSSIDDFNLKSNESLKNLTYSVSTSIKDQKNVLDDKLGEGNRITNDKFTELSTYIHDDIIGEEPLETIKTNTELSYLYDRKKDELILNSQSEQIISSYRDSIAKLLKDSLYGPFEHSKITYNEDGSFTKTTYSGDLGLSEILANLTVIERLPDYNQFMVKVVPELFTNVDFENFYEVQYDSYGNVISTQRRNPVNVAKASIYRADVLWKELKKRGIVE